MNRANGLALVSLIALIGTARAQSGTTIVPATFGPLQLLGSIAILAIGVALVREFSPKRAGSRI